MPTGGVFSLCVVFSLWGSEDKSIGFYYLCEKECALFTAKKSDHALFNDLKHTFTSAMRELVSYRGVPSPARHLFFGALYIFQSNRPIHQQRTSADTLPTTPSVFTYPLSTKKWIEYHGICVCAIASIFLEPFFLYKQQKAQKRKKPEGLVTIRRYRFLDLIGLLLYIALFESISWIYQRLQNNGRLCCLNHTTPLFFFTVILLPALCWSVCWTYAYTYYLFV